MAKIVPSTKGSHNTHKSWIGQSLDHLHWVCTDSGAHRWGCLPPGVQTVAKNFWLSLSSHGQGLGEPQSHPPMAWLDSQGHLTSMAALTAVSEPRLKSVPGTLLLMVAGMTHMTMQSSS